MSNLAVACICTTVFESLVGQQITFCRRMAEVSHLGFLSWHLISLQETDVVFTFPPLKYQMHHYLSAIKGF